MCSCQFAGEFITVMDIHVPLCTVRNRESCTRKLSHVWGVGWKVGNIYKCPSIMC